MNLGRPLSPPWRGRQSSSLLPKAVRVGDGETALLKRCHPSRPLARATSPSQPRYSEGSAINKVTEVGNSRLRLGEVTTRPYG